MGRNAPRHYAFFFLLFAVLLFFSHLPLLGLNYFWDEVEQYVPAALDIYHSGAFVPHSAVPNVHPPGVPAYLAAFWKVAGYSPVSTRCAMLLLASCGVLAAFLVAIELSKDAPGPTLPHGRVSERQLAVCLLCCSPVFFAQSMMANLDAPAMFFTALALLLFLRERIRACAAVCVVLVLVKETGIAAPAVFAAWLLWERRWREALWLIAPVIALAAWLGCLYHATGYWSGNPGFEQYNLYFPLQPVRLLTALGRRVYSLFFASFQWIGTAALLIAWRRGAFRSRSWKIAWGLVAVHTLLVTALGGAVLTRYLLPIVPIVYAAMATGVTLLPTRKGLLCGASLMLGLAASNFVNPPYQFPYEDNLAFVDFVKLQSSAASFLEERYAGTRVTTAWPLTRELARPELGYVSRGREVETLRNLTPQTLRSVNWNRVRVFVAFSRTWDPPYSLSHFGPVRWFWQHFYGFTPNVTRETLAAQVPLPLAAQFERRGQWVAVYAKAD